jgi:hypothetical protein
MTDRKCPSCGTSFSDTLTCPSCGHNLASSVVSTQVAPDEPQTDTNPSERTGSSESRSAAELASTATGNITEKFLKKTSSIGDTYLFDGPLINHLRIGEQPEYILQGSDGGLRIVKDDGSDELVHPDDAIGRRYLLFTDQRLLAVTGCEDGDRSYSVDFDDIISVDENRELTSGKISFETNDGTRYIFKTNRHAGTLDEAATYLREQIPAEVDVSNSAARKAKRNIISVLITYGIIAAVGWFLVPRLLAPGFSDPAFGQEPWTFAEGQRRIGGFIVVVSIAGALWHGLDALQEIRPRISRIGRRIIFGIMGAVVGLCSTAFVAAMFADAGALGQQNIRIIIIVGIIIGFAFGFAVGDDPWRTEDWRFTE